MADEWQTVPFEQLLAEPVRNGIYKPKEFHGRGAKIVNMGELFAHPRLRAVPMKRVELSSSEGERFMLSKGDLLFARRSLVAEGAGKCSVVLEIDEPTTFESSIIRARPDTAKAEPLYLYYFFNSTSGLHCLDTIRRQVAVAGITGSDLSRLEIPVPGVPEQRAIARILGTLDDKIALNRRMNETLETMARALFKSWFVDFDPVRAKMEGGRARQDGARSGQPRKPLKVASDLPWPGTETGAGAEGDPDLPKPLAALFPDRFEHSELGEIPAGWAVKTIEAIATRVGIGPFGSSIKVETFVPAGVPVISGQHLHGFMVEDNTFNFVAPEHAERLKNAIVQRGDVVFTHAGNIGQAAYIPKNSRYDRYVISQRQFFMRCDPAQVTPSFVAFYFRSTEGQHRLLANASSSGVPSIARPVTYLRSIQLSIPPNPIMDAFEKLVQPLLLQFRRNLNEVSTLATLRDTLLPKLISGELPVKDAERQIAQAI